MSADAEDRGDPAESSAFRTACETLVERLLEGELDPDDLETAKVEVCGQLSAPKVPKNTDLVEAAPPDRREELRSLVARKPVRTASGVTPVAIMTSPHACPHGKCLYCPGGPGSEFSSAQAYTGQEPAAARAIQNDYDPYGQVSLRLHQLRHIGHPVDKVELILMGGTMTARSADYQTWFVRRALEAMNDHDVTAEPAPADDGSFVPPPDEHPFRYLEDVVAENETADVRCIGMTFETKPDWCDPEQVDRMLRLGGTKVEVGVQTTFDEVNRAMHRGHGVEASRDANRRLRDAGFKVGFHMMPGQPGMTPEMDRRDFRRLFESPDWRPDYLKIYPTLVVRGTATYDMWRRDEYEPLDNEAAAELVAEVKADLPRYVRLQRVQRDIPADLIDAGVWKSNLRQLARERLAAAGGRCDCIRCREVGHREATPDRLELSTTSYAASGGTEHFLEVLDPDQDLLVGFCRLRFPGDVRRRELEDAAIVRELHVYGGEVEVGREGVDGQHQHRGHGRRLMAAAERRAADAGFERLAVISGIGARAYYRDQLGYRRDGPYMVTRLT